MAAAAIEVPKPARDATDRAEYKKLREAERTAPPQESATPAEEPTESSEPKGESEPVAEPGETKTQEPKQSRRKPDAEARIKELNAEAKREKERADRLERELQDSRTRKPEPSEPPAATKAAAPKEDDPKPTLAMYTADAKSYEEAQEKYSEALLEWRDRQKEKANATKAAETRSAEAKAKIRQTVEQAKTKHPNFSEEGGKVMLPFSPQGWENFFGGKDFDHPIDVLQHLHANPQEHTRLMELAKVNPNRFVAELMFIDRSMAKAPDNPKPQQPVSRVPPPPPRVGGGTNPPEPAHPRDARNFGEYKRHRKAQGR
jgi:hypothetical protein